MISISIFINNVLFIYLLSQLSVIIGRIMIKCDIDKSYGRKTLLPINDNQLFYTRCIFSIVNKDDTTNKMRLAILSSVYNIIQ